MVQNPIEINYADLIAKPLVEHMTTLTCVSNEVGGDLAGNALWLGYRSASCWPRRSRSRRRHGAVEEPRWLDRKYAAVGLTDPNREAMLAIGANGDPCPLSMDSLCAWSSQACTGTCPRRSG